MMRQSRQYSNDKKHTSKHEQISGAYRLNDFMENLKQGLGKRPQVSSLCIDSDLASLRDLLVFITSTGESTQGGVKEQAEQ